MADAILASGDIISFKPCSVSGCAGNASRHANGAAGLCCAHYKRKKKTGDPLGSTRKQSATLAWLTEHIGYASDECLTWPFYRIAQGYGQLYFEGKTRLAHRVMCLLAHGGDIESASDVAHSCGLGHEGCVNPRHLRWDTRSGNFADKLVHGTDSRGSKSPVSKLTEDDVRQIRALHGKLEQKEIALMYRIDQSAVSKIQTRKSWSWME